MITPKRFGTSPHSARLGELNPRGESANPTPQRVAEGVPLGKFIRRDLLISPEVVMVSAPRSAAAERFRRLKTLLLHDADGEPQVIIVTSALPGEGKSLVSLNLALAFAADVGGDTLLVDADIRRPGINRWIKPAPRIGLKEVLAGEATLEHGLLEVPDQKITVLPAGEPPWDPVPLLSGPSAWFLVEGLRQRFKRIIIDTPPIVPFTDADILASYGDGVVMVVRSKATPKPLLEQAIQSITSSRILGLVLNDTTTNLADRYRHYDNYYQKYYHAEADR